jgi:hypothetical protein
MVDRRWGAGAPWAEQIATASGVVFVVLAMVAFALVGDAESGASTDEIITYFGDNADRVQIGAALFGLAGGFLLWFGGTIASALRRSEGDVAGRLPAIAIAGVASSVALYLIGVGSWTAFARTAEEEGASRALYDLGQQIYGMSSFTAAVFIWALSTGIMRTRLLADWVGWAGTALTVLLVVDGFYEMVRDSSGLSVLGTITFVAFLAWVLIASVMLTMGVRARSEARPATAAP